MFVHIQVSQTKLAKLQSSYFGYDGSVASKHLSHTMMKHSSPCFVNNVKNLLKPTNINTKTGTPGDTNAEFLQPKTTEIIRSNSLLNRLRHSLSPVGAFLDKADKVKENPAGNRAQTSTTDQRNYQLLNSQTAASNKQNSMEAMLLKTFKPVSGVSITVRRT